MLPREQILAARENDVDTVDVPEWGGSVGMRKMSCREAEAFHDWLNSRQADGSVRVIDLRATLLSKVLCDAEGKRLFTEDDIEALGEKSSDVMHRLFIRAKGLNLIVDDAVEETEKNSAAGR
jgi:hypothetical protein